MTDDTVELKPCPFCGGVAKAIKPLMDRRQSGPPWYNTGHRIVCAASDCSGCGNAETTYTKAVTQWNTRSAMPQQEVTVKALVWDVDGRKVRFDGTMMMGKGYDWDGWEVMREEAYVGFCSYAIWPDHISSDQYNLYCTLDGTYMQSLAIEAAKASAQAHYEATILSALSGQDAEGET